MTHLFTEPAVPQVIVPEITTIAPWFGGKRNLSPRIVALKPPKCNHRMGFGVDGMYRCQKCRKLPASIRRESK